MVQRMLEWLWRSLGSVNPPRRLRQRAAARRLDVEFIERRTLLSHVVGQHIHPHLEINIEGQHVLIPAAVGIIPATEMPGMSGMVNMLSPHTHDTSGFLHTGEGSIAGIDPPDAQLRLTTLKDFFDVWRTTNPGTARNNPNALFNQNQILQHAADATHPIRMTVNGQPNFEFENYSPHDGDQVVITYGLIPLEITGDRLSNVIDVTLNPATQRIEVRIDGRNPDPLNPGGYAAADLSAIRIRGLAGNDTIRVDPAITVPADISGDRGHDRITAGGGDDTISGGTGNDLIEGGPGDDVVTDIRGHDTMSGGTGSDYLDGGRGNDSIDGGDGDDVLRAGAGRLDSLIGGPGSDVFHATDLSRTDFTPGADVNANETGSALASLVRLRALSSYDLAALGDLIETNRGHAPEGFMP